MCITYLTDLIWRIQYYLRTRSDNRARCMHCLNPLDWQNEPNCFVYNGCYGGAILFCTECFWIPSNDRLYLCISQNAQSTAFRRYGTYINPYIKEHLNLEHLTEQVRNGTMEVR